MYKSKFKICNDDANYIVLLKEYLGDDNWSCEFGIYPENHPDSKMCAELAGSTITGKGLFTYYTRIK